MSGVQQVLGNLFPSHGPDMSGTAQGQDCKMEPCPAGLVAYCWTRLGVYGRILCLLVSCQCLSGCSCH